MSLVGTEVSIMAADLQALLTASSGGLSTSRNRQWTTHGHHPEHPAAWHWVWGGMIGAWLTSSFSTDLDLTNYKALSFDWYGTLIDWESGIAAVLAPWAREQGLDLSNEDLMLAYADHEAAVERETPAALYPDVLAAAFRRTGDKLQRPVTG